MRFYSILVLFLFFISSVSAQHLGFRGGVHFSNLSIVEEEAYTPFDAQTNVMFGTFIDIPVGGKRFLLSPEVSYVGRGYNMATSIETNINYLDLGALAKYTLTDLGAFDFYVGGGPVLSYALNGNLIIGTETQNLSLDTDFNRINASLAVVGGLTLGERLFIEGRYLHGFGTIEEETLRSDRTSRFHSIGVTAGIRIPLGN